MIAKLMGILDSIWDGYVIVNVSGVGYRVFCSTKTISNLSGVNQPVSLFIETQVREDSIRLFGFLTPTEQDLFNTLTVVQGVGAKVGLAILSALSVQEIQMAVMSGDAKAFTRVSGIGPKLATRLVTELKGKLGSLGTNEELQILGVTTNNQISNKILDDALSALVNLGYARTEAGIVIAQILKENTDISTGELIRLALKEMGKNF
ncbi:MAG: Holliday junction branch migration protein RuvA [Alphaproteobacteria bacterium]|nr:Holliday junction branch migration protein RuvA [Alphaproteobacteria bacterium]